MVSQFEGNSGTSAASADVPADPPGCLHRHSKTGGIYWKLPAHCAPERLRKPGRAYVDLPVVLAGGRYATKSMRRAVARRRALWRQWHSRGDPRPAGRRMEALIEEFRRLGAVKSSARRAADNARMVRRFCREMSIDDPLAIDSESVQAFIVALHDGDPPASAQTVHHHRNAVRQFCSLLVRRGILDANPAARDLIVVPPIRWGPPRFLSVGQVSSLLLGARMLDAELAAPIELALLTGLRLRELRAARRSDVAGGHLTVRGKLTGLNPWRVVPLPPRALAAVEAGAGEGGLLFAAAPAWRWCRRMAVLTKRLPVFGGRGGGAGNQWHLLRSTWAVCMAAGRTPLGGPTHLGRPATLWELMALGGWTVPQTVMRYVSLARVVELGLPGPTAP